MQKLLVVDDDTLICDVVAISLQDWADTEVTCAFDGYQGAQRLQETHFDLALIDGTLPGIAGFRLAEIAANKNTPALLICGHPQINDQLDKFGFPYLAKPFPLAEMLEASRQAIANAAENIIRVKVSAARMRASMDGLKR